MTETITPAYTVPAPEDFDIDTFRAHEAAWRIWRDECHSPADTVESDFAALTREHPGQGYNWHIRAFCTWLIEHPEHQPIPVVTTPVLPVVAIGPEHPGWADWWDALWAHAEEAGYTEEYNKLAEAMGGPEHTDPELQYAVEVRIDSFYVTLYRSARASDADSSEFNEQIDQSDIDEAVREYVRDNNVDWEVSDYDEV